MHFTDLNGDYQFINPTIQSGIPYRIEFSELPEGFTISNGGGTVKTETVFVNDVRCDVDLGIFIPGECVTESDGSPNSNDIRVVTTCFVNGDI